MRSIADNLIGTLVGLALCLTAPVAQADGPATIRRLSLIEGSTVELEIAASGPVKPRAQVIQNPERLVLDFPDAVPAKSLHNLDINRGEVVGARVGLFSSHPAVTRVVLDLKSPQAYQLFPSGSTVVVKFAANSVSSAAPKRVMSKPAAASPDGAPETIVTIERTGSLGNFVPAQPAAQVHSATLTASAVAGSRSPLEVLFENGLLSIRANRANMSQVLSEVRRRTGAEIAIPPGAESEQVFTNLGPGAPKEVLASLLNGSHFNFVVIGSEGDPGGIRRVVLTPKQGGVPEAVVYPCGTTEPAMAQIAPQSGPPAQAFEPPMPPEQSDSGDQAQGPPQPPAEQ